MSIRQYYRRHLPHFQNLWDHYFVTFRLKGSLPAILCNQKEQQERLLPSRVENPFVGFRETGNILDRAKSGPIWLKQENVAEIIANSILFHHPDTYQIISFCIMPNHVHMVFHLESPNSINTLIGSIKSFTARRINHLIRKKGALWQDESFDRVIRSGKLKNAVHYTLMNPVNGNLPEKHLFWPFTYLNPDYAHLDTAQRIKANPNLARERTDL